jgi:hypothetical protein
MPDHPASEKRIHIGSRVCIADDSMLGAWLHGPSESRPEPGQMACAGRREIVSGYRRGAGDRPLYVLQDSPGLWPEEWIDAL